MSTLNKPAFGSSIEGTEPSSEKSPPDLLYGLPYDPYLSSSTRTRQLLGQRFSFRDSAIIRKLDVLDNVPTLGDYNIDTGKGTGLLEADHVGRIQLYLLWQNYRFKPELALSQEAFLQLLKICAVPPVYLEVFLNNNGAYSSFVTYSPGSKTVKDLCLLVKLPYAGIPNGSFFFRYSFAEACTTCIVSTLESTEFDARLREVFYGRNSDKANQILQPDPFIFLSLLFEHFSIQMETEREFMDRTVCTQESRSGVEVHAGFTSVGQAKIGEYVLFKRDLHLIEASISVLQRALEFQVELAQFLVAEHANFAKLNSEGHFPSGATYDMSELARVNASLSINASLARCRLDQVGQLSKRVQIQLTLAESRMTSYDTLTGLRIARDTQRDSVSMKTIAWLTMVFLPATFVATFFSMGIFQFNPDTTKHGHISVAAEWWLYLAVTLPLTVVVLGVWNGWLWWSEKNSGENSRMAWDDTF